MELFNTIGQKYGASGAVKDTASETAADTRGFSAIAGYLEKNADRLNQIAALRAAQSFWPQSIGMAEQSLKMRDLGAAAPVKAPVFGTLPELHQHMMQKTNKAAIELMQDAQAAAQEQKKNDARLMLQLRAGVLDDSARDQAGTAVSWSTEPDYAEYVQKGRGLQNPTVQALSQKKRYEPSAKGFLEAGKDLFQNTVGKIPSALKEANAWAVYTIPGYGPITGQGMDAEYAIEPKTHPIQNKVTFSREIDQKNNGAFDVTSAFVVAGGAYHRLYSYMTEGEVDDYSYLLARYGEEKADAYLERLMPTLQEREMQPHAEQATKSTGSKVRSFFSTTGEQLIGGVAGFAGDALELLTTGKFDPYSANNYLQNKVRAERGAISESLSSDDRRAVYNLAQSAADMVAALLVGQVAGSVVGGGSTASPLLTGSNAVTSNTTSAIMAANAASNTVIEAKERGLSDDQAMTLALLLAGVEMITEHFSVEQLLTNPKGAMGYVLKSAVTEGAEEGASNILGTVADVIVARDKSYWNTAIENYRASGMSYEDAFKAAFKDQVQSMNMDVLGGMATGSLLSGTVAGYSAGSDAIQNARAKRAGATQSTPAESPTDAPSWVQQSRERAAESDVQSMRAVSEQAVQGVQLIGQKSVSDFTSEDFANTQELADRYWEELGAKSPFYRAQNGDWRENDQMPIVIANKAGSERGVTRNDDTGWDIQVSEKVFNETGAHQSQGTVIGRQYIGHLNDIIKNAVLLDSYGVGKKKNVNSTMVHSLYAVADIGEGPQVLKLYVDEMRNPNDNGLIRRAYKLRGVKIVPTGVIGSGQNVRSHITNAGTIHTVADLFAFVKANDKNFNPKTHTTGGTQAYAGMDGVSPRYNWTADNRNEGSSAEVVSLSELVEDIKNQFGVTVNKGKLSNARALGEFHKKSEGIRLRTANEVAVLCHELGHFLDKQFGVARLPSIQTAIDIFKASTPNLAAQYKDSEIYGEAVAEFVRRYATDRTAAQRDYGTFYEEFVGALDSATLQKLDAVGNKMNAYMSAGAYDRMSAAIQSTAEHRAMRRRSEGAKRMAKRLSKLLYTRIFDEADPIKGLTEKGYRRFYHGKKANVVAEGILIGDRMVGFDRERAAMRDVNGNVVQDENGQTLHEKSLAQVLEPLTTDTKGKENLKIEEDFNLYLVCRRGLELPGIRVFADPTLDNPAAMRRVANELEAQYPQFREVAEDLYRWQRSMLYTWGVQTGVISLDTFQKLGEKYQAYVPLQRHIDPASGKAKKNAGQIIKSIHGSGLDIIRPIDSIAVNVQKMVGMAHRNAVLQEVARAADNVEGAAIYAERVRPDMVQNSVSTDALFEAMAAAGFDEQGSIDFVDLLNATYGDRLSEWQVSRRQSPNIVTVMQNGSPTYYRINDPELLNALVDTGPSAARTFLDVMAAINRPFKALTTGSNFIWNITKNLPADFQTGYVNSTEKNPIKYAVQNVKAWIEMITQSEGYKQFRAAGGGYSSYIGRDTKKVSSIAASLFNTGAGTVRGNLQRMMEGIEAFNNAIEASPRFAEAQRAKAEGADWMDAVFAGDELTTNFSRGGRWTKELDKAIPYTNAAVQGLWREGKQFKEHPVSTSAKLLASSVILAALVYGINHLTGGEEEYEKLSNRTKNNYYCFHVGDGHFVKIAKARQLSVIESAIERAFESLAGDDPDAFYGFADYITSTFSPIGSNPFFSTASDLRANESFSGAAIVPQNMQSLPKEEQYDGRTSYLARGIGELFGVSPMKVDYAINQWTGILGDVVTTIAPEGDWAGTLGGRNVTADAAYSTDALNVLYEQREELEKRKNSVKNPDTAALYSYKAYDAVIGTLSAINKYGKAHESEERACRMLARDEALAFREGFAEDADLIRLYEATGDGDVFPFRQFSTEFSHDGERYALSPTDTVQMMHDYNDAIESAYEEILGMDLTDEQKVAALKKTKENVYEAVCAKFAAFSSGDGDADAPITTNTAGLSDGEYASLRSELATLEKANDPKVSERGDAEVAKEFLEASTLDPAQRAAVWADAGHLTEDGYRKYADCGLDRSQAEQFAYHYSGVVGDKDADGKTISGSKKANVCKAIDDFCDEQGLSKEVKYRLYAAYGYKESKASDVPWYQPSDENRDWFDDLW